jgi:hypothetical protein
MMTNKLLSIGLLFHLFILSGIGNLSAAENLQQFSKYVDKEGNISMPENFRQTMTHLGSWFVPKGDASGFHDVYARQADVSIYRKTGQFPDGAVLIKELRVSKKADYTTGKNVSYATESVKQWFVMIKDTKNRFPKNKSWGDGWGWALFKTNSVDTNASNDYKKDCLSCHLPAKKNGLVYLEGYPTLSK